MLNSLGAHEITEIVVSAIRALAVFVILAYANINFEYVSIAIRY
ncbi:hypothetical protein R4K54_10075 [Brachyspira murdochii]|nr:hypothetical protein [Brachyspira murdochii]